MTHADMDELYELYVLGVLEPAESNEIDEHVTTDCAHCLDAIQKAFVTASALAELAEPVAPPPGVRERLVAAITPAKPARRWSWAVFVLGAASVCLFAVAIWSNNTLQTVRQRLSLVVGERDQLRSAVEILSRQETRTIQFGPATSGPHGRLLVNPKGGFVVTGSDLPPIAEDKTFELWLVPANGQPPVPAGLFRPDANNSFVHVSRDPVDPAKIAAVAVSVEPRAGSLAPTTKPFLIVPLT
jgi:anti-sigma-K factor RskA